MSNKINDELYDKALEVMEYFTGTLIERTIQRDLDSDDLEALKYHVDKAWRQMRFEDSMELEYNDSY